MGEEEIIADTGDNPQEEKPVGGGPPIVPKGLINCDQACWLIGALTRYEETIRKASEFPGISRLTQAAKASCVIEIAEILNFGFEGGAKQNVIVDCLPELFEKSPTGLRDMLRKAKIPPPESRSFIEPSVFRFTGYERELPGGDRLFEVDLSKLRKVPECPRDLWFNPRTNEFTDANGKKIEPPFWVSLDAVVGGWKKEFGASPDAENP